MNPRKRVFPRKIEYPLFVSANFVCDHALTGRRGSETDPDADPESGP